MKSKLLIKTGSAVQDGELLSTQHVVSYDNRVTIDLPYFHDGIAGCVTIQMDVAESLLLAARIISKVAAHV